MKRCAAISLFAFTLLSLGGCKSLAPWNWGFFGDESAQNVTDNGSLATFATFKSMSWLLLAPGIIAWLGSHAPVPFAAGLRKPAGALIALGFCAAATPWLLELIGPMVWVVLGCALVVGAILFARHLKRNGACKHEPV